MVRKVKKRQEERAPRKRSGSKGENRLHWGDAPWFTKWTLSFRIFSSSDQHMILSLVLLMLWFFERNLDLVWRIWTYLDLNWTNITLSMATSWCSFKEILIVHRFQDEKEPRRSNMTAVASTAAIPLLSLSPIEIRDEFDEVCNEGHFSILSGVSRRSKFQCITSKDTFQCITSK